jgi:hypothetical protein
MSGKVPPTPLKPVPAPAPAPARRGLRSWFTQDLWDTILPYADLSAVWCPSDKKPMYTYDAFMDAVDWMNNHVNKEFHGFGASGDDFVNKHEVAAYLANMAQETGDPSLTAPFPWSWPKVQPTGAVYEGSCGGGICLIEGIAPVVAVHEKGTPPPYTGQMVHTINDMRPVPKKVLGLRDNEAISIVIQDLSRGNLPQYGLASPGVAFQPGLCCVSQTGILYGDEPRSEKDVVIPSKELVRASNDPKYTCKETFCSFMGRTISQLSYSFNYNDCSIDLFGDYRLVRFPNLLVTIDRHRWNGFPKTFGFPGPRLDGSNPPPRDVDVTTPNARILGHVATLWFWMTPRSGRKISCHGCMLQPTKYGITSVNCVVNSQSGLIPGTWAADKISYYRRICLIMGIDCSKTIVSPVGQP